VKFEWDEGKNRENINKHKLDFTDAWEIFAAPMLINLDTREDYGDGRWIGIGFLKNFVVVVVYTENEDVIRLISLRKALTHERTRFKEALRNELGESQ
jgi:uncharacterized DUF497 family protein